MIKRLLITVLAISIFVLGGCSDKLSKETVAAAKEINAVAEKANSQTRTEGEYTLSITFSEGVVLYYADGEVAWDREDNRAFAQFDQTYLGDSSSMFNYYRDGKMISIDDGVVHESEKSAESIFSKFPYFKAFLHDDSCGEIAVGKNSSGDTYTFRRTDTKEVFESLVGGDIYSLVFSIQNPQPEKTEYGEIECVYTVSDGNLLSCRYEFDVKLFDTPAYVPGYTPPKEDYTIDLHISAKVTYNSFGDSVTIREYSAENSESSVSDKSN